MATSPRRRHPVKPPGAVLPDLRYLEAPDEGRFRAHVVATLADLRFAAESQRAILVRQPELSRAYQEAALARITGLNLAIQCIRAFLEEMGAA
jgi:hypothetical protein